VLRIFFPLFWFFTAAGSCAVLSAILGTTALTVAKARPEAERLSLLLMLPAAGLNGIRAVWAYWRMPYGGR